MIIIIIMKKISNIWKYNLFVEINAADFIQWCQKKYKVSAIPGILFSYSGKSHNYLRLSISFHRKEVLKTATKSLCEALLNYVRKNIDYK